RNTIGSSGARSGGGLAVIAVNGLNYGPMTSRLAAFITPGASLPGAVDRVQLAEKLGYEAVFSTQIGARDGLMTLAAYASATSKIKLGTGVIPAFPRHPVAL